MPNPENIEPHKFEPGQSGNPNGRPLGSKNLSTILREMLEEEIDVVIDGVKTKKKFKDAIIRKLMKKAHDGDLKAIIEIFDRVEGKAKQELTVQTEMELKGFKIAAASDKRSRGK